MGRALDARHVLSRKKILCNPSGWAEERRTFVGDPLASARRFGQAAAAIGSRFERTFGVRGW